MNKISIVYPEWLSLEKLASWTAEGFSDRGFEVATRKYSSDVFRYLNEPFLFVTGGGVDSQFLRLCGMYKKKGTIWIDVFYHTKHIDFVVFQKRFRNCGGKFISTSEYDKNKLEANGVIVDAILPRCIPDKVFDYKWQGKKKSVIGVGATDLRHEAVIYGWAKVPDELKKASRKGHEYLVKFAENNPDWSVTLVSRREQLSRICDTIDLSNLKIIEAGTVSSNDIYNMIASSGVYAHPCRYEPFGLGIIEAEAIGVPTCFTCLPQQVEIGGGIMIPYKDNYNFPSGISLATIDYTEVEKGIYKCYDLGDTLSEMGKENAQKFRVSTIVKRLIEVMELA